ncbi:MAG: (S)-ureidoglycine aminohydrolase [Candidatus Solibacter usitatus]|nr:(S)-ureidoglycine aminohydrolase [Candidatus Solibacter usitatus]
MHHIGNTRSSSKRDHLLHTPDAFVRAALPGMQKAAAIVHAAPAMGAAFTQYTAEMEQGGTLGQASGSRFLYVLEGSLRAGGRGVTAGQYVYHPPDSGFAVAAAQPSRVVVIEKDYLALPQQDPPKLFFGDEANVTPYGLEGDTWLNVRQLLPADQAFDFAVNTMTYQPGATLPNVEIHVMEHGLLMLAGSGIYRLGDDWYPVSAGDFIWMGPYCPQWFGALGKTPAKYLIYKDWNRHPLASRGK